MSKSILKPEENQSPGDYHQRVLACEQKLSEAGVLNSREVVGVPYGWLRIIEAASDKLINALNENEGQIKILQIKEKFGELRMYMRGDTPEIQEAVSEIQRWAEEQSIGRCIATGGEGHLVSIRGWYLTLCDDAERMAKDDRKKLSDLIYPPEPEPRKEDGLDNA